MDDLFLLGRILFGSYFIYGGANHFLSTAMMAQFTAQKGVPMPEAAVLVAGLLLLIGGFSLLLGLWPHVGVASIVLFLAVVTPIMHNFWTETDPMQRMIASVAHTGELFVIISYTGRTRELVEVARIARGNGASVLGVTAENSPLAKASTVSLNIPLPEDTDIYMPMTSRIIQLTVLDVLATGMTLRRGVDFQPHLRKIKESLNDSRYPVGDEFN